MTPLRGKLVKLRPAEEEDVIVLSEIRKEPEVYEHWGGNDFSQEHIEVLNADDIGFYVILDELENVQGAILWEVDRNPDYRKAALDIYLHPKVHGQGMGSDAIRAVVQHLFEQGHHRITIDPAADNHAAIRCYEKVGFQRVGIMRKYERGPDGRWHDGLLMDLLAEEFIPV